MKEVRIGPPGAGEPEEVVDGDTLFVYEMGEDGYPTDPYMRSVWEYYDRREMLNGR
jgi:hypothetical protein